MKREAMGSTKLKRLCHYLGIRTYSAAGIMESLWHLTAREAPQGDIGKLADEDIALGIDWDGDTGKLINALVSSKWLDPDPRYRLIVHDWHEHADDATDNKLARSGRLYANGKPPRMNKLSVNEKERLTDKFGYSVRTNAHAVRTNAHECALPVPVPVPVPVPDTSAITNTSPIGSCEKKAGPVRIDSKTSGLGIEFDEVWPRFWIRTGKGAAKSAWAKARNKASRETIEAAIVLQGPGILALAKQRGSTPVHPSTWLNQERWEDDVGGLAVVESPKYSGNQQQVMAMFDERMALNLNAQQRH